MICFGILLAFGLVHVFYAQEIMNALVLRGGWLNFIRESFFERAGTGAIGALLAYPAYAALGKWGGFVVLLFLLLLDIVLLRHISLRAMGERAQAYVQRSYNDFRQQQSVRAEERRIEREERQQAREARLAELRAGRGAASWNDPTFSEDGAPLEPVSEPPTPGTQKTDGGLFRVPEYLKSDARRGQKPVLTRPDKARQPEAQASEQPSNTPDGIEQTDVSSDVAPAADTAASADAFDGYGELPEDALPDVDPDEMTDDAEPEDIPDYDSDDDIYDGFDDMPDEAPDPPFDVAQKPERKPRRAALGEPAAVRAPQQPKPSFTDAPISITGDRRIDHTPIVVTPPDRSHDLTPTGAEYNYPPVDLLALPRPTQVKNAHDKDQEKAIKLEETLNSFGISVTLTNIAHGPAVTRFELAPAAGVKVSRITALDRDIALNLAAESVRIEAPIPGKAAVGVEIPNDVVETVPLREVLESQEARKNPSRLAVAMGKDNSGRCIIGDIAKMPHVLIAGATGSGKSVCINCIVCSILYRATPDEVRLIMIDPKVVELSIYNGIPHLLQPVVTDPKKAAGALHWAVAEMDTRYKKFAEKHVRDIKGYNKQCAVEGEAMMPQIVIIIDELADLMMVAPGEVEDAICRLAQLARAAGIHLVIATQRPSVNVITGVIKANIPARIAFTVASFVDSRTILDVGGAEKLLGRGDMLFAPAGSNKMQRVQGAWVSDDEINAIVEYIKSRHEPEYNSELLNYMDNRDENDEDAGEDEGDRESDKLLPQAMEIAINAGQVSISMLQRKLSIGYARAGRLVDEMAKRGYVSDAEGSKPRAVIMTREEYARVFGAN
ncbi:MAG: DNA translocase FtsK [Clostridia bacterium]|nr:DNA translocase FtsK [Clostridia bacterium]